MTYDSWNRAALLLQANHDDTNIRKVIAVVEEIRGRQLIGPWQAETIALLRGEKFHDDDRSERVQPTDD